MSFPMDDNLNNFDVFPLVYKVQEETEINIRPTGGRRYFEPGKHYTLCVCGLEDGKPSDYPITGAGNFIKKEILCNEDGCFRFNYAFPSEQQYFLRIYDGEDWKYQFPVYAVNDDLASRYPYMGDLHMHTICSDGNQTPEVVCANYRRHGYDFMTISDHGRYYPSLKAINFYKNVPTGLNIVPGEEVHLPPVNGQRVDPHIVNFGGEYSINALVEDVHIKEVGKDKKFRSIRDNCPDVMTKAEYEEKMSELSEKIEVPEGIDPIPAAVTKWIFNEIKRADGLGIFAHPEWISDVFQVPTKFYEYLFENRDFDAFEVLGGENYFEQNGFQTAIYYDNLAKGRKFPIVGSTDSHSSYESNRNAFICATIVFSPENERKSLISSIKDYYSVAVDKISKEFRIVGDLRLTRYTCFLLKNYFPRHDELCIEEGRLMKQYATGTKDEKEEALKVLETINGRVNRLMKKYFAF